MKRLATLLVVVAVLASFVAGCAAPTPQVVEKEVIVEKEVPVTVEVEKVVVVEKVVTPTPPPIGGIPVIILDGEPNNLHPLMAASRVTFTVLDEVNGFLARYDEDFNIIPSLATSWDVVDDRTVRFHLRKGVKFHNGEEMTADDVKFSIEAHLDPEQGSTTRARLEAVDYVEVEEDYTAVVHLKEPYAPLLDVLIDRVPILPRSVYETPRSALNEPVGCGPFKFKEWRMNSYVLLERFEDYWEEGLPKSEGLKYLFLSEYNSAKASFLSKESDTLLYIDPVDLPLFEKIDGVVIDGASLFGFGWIGMNTEREPFNDVRVRQAVKYVTDRQQYIDVVSKGHDQPAFLPIANNSPFYSSKFEYGRDVEKAKQLLAEAGYPDGLEVELLTPKTPTEEPIGVLCQSQLKEIGINAELVVLDVPSFLERVFTDKDYQIHICGDTSGPDPASLLNRYYMSTSPTNVTHYNNPKVDELLTKAATTFDTAERAKYYEEAGLLMLEDSPMVWRTGGKRFSVYWDYLDGFVNLGTLRYEFWNLEFVKLKK